MRELNLYQVNIMVLARQMMALQITAICILVVGTVGCSKQTPSGTVSGRVTYGGQPVDEGQVQFISANGGAAVGTLNPDGSYSLQTSDGDDVPIGDYQVSVGPVIPDGIGAADPPPPKDPKNIPKKFRSVATSGLSRTINEGHNEHNIELKN